MVRMGTNRSSRNSGRTLCATCKSGSRRERRASALMPGSSSTRTAPSRVTAVAAAKAARTGSAGSARLRTASLLPTYTTVGE